MLFLGGPDRTQLRARQPADLVALGRCMMFGTLIEPWSRDVSDVGYRPRLKSP